MHDIGYDTCDGPANVRLTYDLWGFRRRGPRRATWRSSAPSPRS